MIEHIGTLIGYLGSALGLVSTAYMFRRARRAEVKSKEIDTADQMVDLVVKANEEVAKIRKKENERLCRSIDRLERAIKTISTCAYRVDCPVADSLQHAPASVAEPDNDRHGDRDRAGAGHGGSDRG